MSWMTHTLGHALPFFLFQPGACVRALSNYIQNTSSGRCDPRAPRPRGPPLREDFFIIRGELYFVVEKNCVALVVAWRQTKTPHVPIHVVAVELDREHLIAETALEGGNLPPMCDRERMLTC